jgi:hypothetical protein
MNCVTRLHRWGGAPAISSLGGALVACFWSLLPTLGARAESVLLEVSASLRAAAPAICPPAGARAEVLLRVDAAAGFQQTPDSAQPRVGPRADSARSLVCPRADSAQAARASTNLRNLMSKWNYVATGGGQQPGARSSRPIGQTLRNLQCLSYRFQRAGES